MHTLLAVDDGIWNGNFNLADALFIVAFILFLVAAVIDYSRHNEPVRKFTLPLIAVGLALVALALAVI